MIQNGTNYVYGSNAEQLEYDIDKLFEYKSRPRVKKQHRTNNKARLKAVCITMAIFAACFIIMVRYSIITELNYKVDSVNKKYEQLRNENTRLKVDIESATDLNRIREIAMTKLGMQKPDRFQMVYMSVPKEDFTEVADNYKDVKKPNSIFTAIVDKIGKLTQLLN